MNTTNDIITIRDGYYFGRNLGVMSPDTPKKLENLNVIFAVVKSHKKYYKIVIKKLAIQKKKSLQSLEHCTFCSCYLVHN